MPGRMALRDWFSARSAREQLLLGTAVALLAAWIVVTTVWQPLRDHRAALMAAIADRDRVIAMLGSDVSATDATQRDDRPVPVIVTVSSPEFGLTIRRIEPEVTGVRVALAEAPFGDVIRWLAALEHDHGLVLDGLEMTRQPEPGVVSTTLVLTR